MREGKSGQGYRHPPEATRRHPENPWFTFCSGEPSRPERNRPGRAVFSKGLELDRKNVTPAAPGCSYSGSRDDERALDCYDRVLEIQPDHVVSLYHRRGFMRNRNGMERPRRDSGRFWSCNRHLSGLDRAWAVLQIRRQTEKAVETYRGSWSSILCESGFDSGWRRCSSAAAVEESRTAHRGRPENRSG
jgi:hypothetical protein